MASIKKSKGRMATDVPVEPLAKWWQGNGSLRLHIPRKRRNFRGAGSVPLTFAGWGRNRLLWSAPIREDKDIGVAVALGPYEAHGDRFSYSGHVALLSPAGVILSHCVHRARLTETAKAGLAGVREHVAPVPAVGPETLAWAARQGLFEGFDGDDGERRK